MRVELPNGSERVSLEIPDEKLVGAFRGPSRRESFDVTGTLRKALADPLDAPPFGQAMIPGDRVCVVVDSGLPNSTEILVPILECLAENRIELESVQLVCTPTEDTRDIDRLVEELPDHVDAVALVTHNPSDEHSHAFLATTKSGEQVYLNREVLDADAVLVVGRTGYDPILGFRGTASELFPGLSNDEAQRRSRKLAMKTRSASGRLREQQLCDEVGWLAGLFYAVGVALDRNHEVEEIWVGQAQSVQRAAEEYARTHWTVLPPAKPAELVIATAFGSDRPADWHRVAAALETAQRIVGDDGRILILSDLVDPPGPTTRWLVEANNPWEALDRIHDTTEVDCLATVQCARAVASNRVCLLSQLEVDMVESLSMIPVGSVSEIERLIDHSGSCYLVQDAGLAQVESEMMDGE